MIKKIMIYGVILIGLTFLIGGYFYSKYYHGQVRQQPRMYPYQTYWGPANMVLIIEDLKYKDGLVSYYEILEKHPKSNPSFSVPLKTLPPGEPVYVMGYSEDSVLADVVSYYNRGALFGGSYLRGWVYAKHLHESPPVK